MNDGLIFAIIGKVIKDARKASGMTREKLDFIVDRDTRTIMYHENDGQHPSLNVFYPLTTMFGISVDQFFYPNTSVDEACQKRIDILLKSLNQQELRLVETLIRAIIDARETEET